MTINEYLQNPYGKGSAISGVTKMKEDMMKEYAELLSRFACRIYKYRDEAIFHVVVPSRQRPNVTYDVVLEFKLNNLTSSEISVNNGDFKVFSNCPSFIYTYAHAFRKQGLIISWLDSKYRPEVRKQSATTKNQYDMLGMERSLYLACLYLTKTRRSDLSVINTTAHKPSGFAQIAVHVRTQDQIMEAVRAKILPTDPVAPKGAPGGTLVSRKDAGHEGTPSSAATPKIKSTKKLGSLNSIRKTKPGMARSIKSKSTKRI